MTVADVESVSSLRPRTLDEYIGQERLKTRLRVMVAGAMDRVEPLPPILFLGPPGVGKTSLAAVVADMVGLSFLERRLPLTADELLSALWSIESVGIVMFDELHLWRRQEILLPLVEDRFLDTATGPVAFPWITPVAATTERGKIIEPLRERFEVFEYEPYTVVELGTMLLNMADRVGATMSTEYAVEMAVASAGSTRTLRYLLRTYRNLSAHLGRAPSPTELLSHTGISADGLTKPHRDVLRALLTLGGNGGVERIATVARMDKVAVNRLTYLLIDRRLIIPGSGSKGLILTCDGRARLAQEGS